MKLLAFFLNEGIAINCIIMKKRITHKKWKALGGLSNPKLIRELQKDGKYAYYVIIEGNKEKT